MAQVFWESFPDKKIYAFQGNMGAGKTSFIRALVRSKKRERNGRQSHIFHYQ